MITGAAKVAGVVGWPVAHSLSPLIHNAWIEALGLDAKYVAFPVAPEEFERFVQEMRGGLLVGVNVTAPHKQRAHDLADELGQCAMDTGAANCLTFDTETRRIKADNLDGGGMLLALYEADWKNNDRPVVVLGAGGAARGAVGAFLDDNVMNIRVCARRRETAEALAADFEGVQAFSFDEFDHALSGVSAVINATSAGLNGVGELPSILAAPVTAHVMDMVYRPIRTRFLEAAKARGHPTVDGLSMLLNQAQPSFILFFDVPPPPAEVVDVRALCLRALGDAA